MERIVLEEQDLVVVVKRVSSRELAPCVCGGVAEEKSDTGYVSASELGRPAGARGEDTWSVWTECSSCGYVTERRDWPCVQMWSVTLEDRYGNYLSSSSSFNKEEAVRSAVDSYQDALEGGYLGDC